MLRKISEIYKRTLDSLIVLSCIILAFVMLAVSFDVFSRYFFGKQTLWILQTSENALLYLAFLSAAWVLRKDKHVSIQVFFVLFNPKTQTMIKIITSALSALVYLVIVIFGTTVSIDHFQRNLYIETILKFPKAPVLMIIPICSFFLLIEFIIKVILYAQDWKVLKKGS